jgi:hypothetical protein
MRKIVLGILVAIAMLPFVAQPAQATECTPKGCTGGCHLNRDVSITIDPNGVTIGLEPPIECYS